nr:hypothetical protein [Nocardia terpenica]
MGADDASPVVPDGATSEESVGAASVGAVGAVDVVAVSCAEAGEAARSAVSAEGEDVGAAESVGACSAVSGSGSRTSVIVRRTESRGIAASSPMCGWPSSSVRSIGTGSGRGGVAVAVPP